MICKNCGAEVGIEYRLCPYCYSEIEYPKNNNQPNIIIQNVVPNTNQPFTNQNRIGNLQISPKSKNTALILCALLGLLGIHRFYAGKIGSGLLYFLTFGLFGLGWIYDIIKIASGTFKDGNGWPLVN